jgi:hypothetical protein
MQISEEMLEEFTQLYQQEFGERLNRSNASEIAFRVLTLYELLGKTLPSDRPTPNSKLSGPPPA